MHRNRVPLMCVVGIGRDRCKDREAGQNMGMPANRVMRQRACGFGKNDRKGDESKRLPKLGNLEPNKKGDESATRSREEAPNGTLLGIVTPGCQLGGDIEPCGENGECKEPYSHVSVLPGLEMEIDDDAAIEGERANHHVLHLEVLRFESASKSRDNQHDDGEGESGPGA